jgi:hypothetical protein
MKMFDPPFQAAPSIVLELKREINCLVPEEARGNRLASARILGLKPGNEELGSERLVGQGGFL